MLHPTDVLLTARYTIKSIHKKWSIKWVGINWNPYLPADRGSLQVLDDDKVRGSYLEATIRNAPLKQVTRVSHSSEEVLPESYFSFASTMTHCLQELRKLLDELNHTREQCIWWGGRGGRVREERKEEEGVREVREGQGKGKCVKFYRPGTGIAPGASSSRIS